MGFKEGPSNAFQALVCVGEAERDRDYVDLLVIGGPADCLVEVSYAGTKESGLTS